MHYKTNRQNHDFQIAYFIAGSCRTADAAYAILCDLKEDRHNAIKGVEAFKLRDQAKIIRAERMLQDADPAVRLEGQADLAEIAAMVETTHNNYAAAQTELTFIERCMKALQPLRKYAHLPDAVAHELAQQEEWKLQLIHTAENHLACTGGVPPDHYATMRMHPEFASSILPALEVTQKLIGAARGGDLEAGARLVAHLDNKPFAHILPRLESNVKKLKSNKDDS